MHSKSLATVCISGGMHVCVHVYMEFFCKHDGWIVTNKWRRRRRRSQRRQIKTFCFAFQDVGANIPLPVSCTSSPVLVDLSIPSAQLIVFRLLDMCSLSFVFWKILRKAAPDRAHRVAQIPHWLFPHHLHGHTNKLCEINQSPGSILQERVLLFDVCNRSFENKTRRLNKVDARSSNFSVENSGKLDDFYQTISEFPKICSCTYVYLHFCRQINL
jgi:hypothetical protein